MVKKIKIFYIERRVYMDAITIKLMKPTYCIIRLGIEEAIPSWVYKEDFYAITKTDDELSIVVSQTEPRDMSEYITIEPNWRCFKLLGPLPFSWVGILSKLSTMLAEANISIFAISTYDTDYILIKEDDASRAARVFLDHNIPVV